MESDWQNEEVGLATLPQIEEVSFLKHPKRFMAYRRIQALIFWAFPILGTLIPALIVPGTWIFYVAIPVALFTLLTFATIPIGYKKRSYALRQRDITYKKGWIFNSIVTIPFNRIQHTEISRGPLERKFDLSTLKIYTAGGSTSDLSIPGLEKEEAKQLKDFVAKKAATYE